VIKKRSSITLMLLLAVLIIINSFFIAALTMNGNIAKPMVKETPSIQQSVVDQEMEDDDYQDEEITPQELEKIDGLITEETAKKIALAHIGEGRVTGVESEKEDGRILYGIDIETNNDEVEVEVEASTGEIGEVEWNEEDDDED